jgi:hypothetical protein
MGSITCDFYNLDYARTGFRVQLDLPSRDCTDGDAFAGWRVQSK